MHAGQLWPWGHTLTSLPFLHSLNKPHHVPQHLLQHWHTSLPCFTLSTSHSTTQLATLSNRQTVSYVQTVSSPPPPLSISRRTRWTRRKAAAAEQSQNMHVNLTCLCLVWTTVAPRSCRRQGCLKSLHEATHTHITGNPCNRELPFSFFFFFFFFWGGGSFFSMSFKQNNPTQQTKTKIFKLHQQQTQQSKSKTTILK